MIKRIDFKKIFLYLYSFIFFTINIFIVLVTFYNNIKLFFISLLFLILLLYLFIRYKSRINKLFNNKIILIIFLFIPIILRFSLLGFSYQDVISDEATFYNCAIALSDGKMTANQYIATFPYLYSYIYLLSLVFKVFTNNYKFVILTNILFDLFGAFLFYKFFEKKRNKKKGLIMSFIWLYNPFQIIWCINCLPVVVVNSMIMLCFYIFSLLESKLSCLKSTLIYSAFFGIVLSITNSFRPIMIVLLIAIIIYYVFLYIDKKYEFKNLLLSVIVIIFSFSICNILINANIENKTGYDLASSSSGWTIYLGSRFDTSGQWFYEEKFTDILYSEDFTPTYLHSYFYEKGINNYKNNGIKNIILFLKKANVLTSNFDEFSVDNILNKINFLQIKEIFYIIIKTFWLFFVIMNVYLFKYIKNKNTIYVPYLLFFVGLFLASLLVEVSPRYFTVNMVSLMMGICIIISSISLKNKSEVNMKKLFERLYKDGVISFNKKMLTNLKNDKKMFIVTANPETFMKSEKDEEITKMLLDKNTTVVPDGIGIVKAANILEYDIKERITGIDIANKLLEYADDLEKKVYFFGAKQEVIDSLLVVINEKYPNIKVVGAKNGHEDNKEEIFKDIIKKEPDIVMVALGVPLQEKLIYRYLEKFNKGIFVGVGGSFDVISGQKKRAPKIFIKLNLEWLYRITMEPKRLKRFYDSNIKFLFNIRKMK